MTVRILAATVAVVLSSACASAPPGAKRAQKLLDQGDYAGANRVADEELERYPRSAALWRIKLRAATARGDSQGAVDQYEKWRTLRGGEHDDEALRLMALTTLWRGLQAPSAVIRTAAIQAIERIEVEDLAVDVAELIADDDDTVAAAAAVALLKSHPQAPQVAGQLMTSDSARAREIAVEGVGRKVGELAKDDLLAALGDRDPKVRRVAVSAVLRFAGDDELDKLITMARDDGDGMVRARILRGLAGKESSKLLELGQSALLDPYLGARLAAVHLLDAIGGDVAREALAEAARSHDFMVAFRAAVAHYRAGGAPVLETLERGLASEEWTIRASALNALDGAMPRELALTKAGAAIVDPQVEVRLAAARLLMRLGQKDRAHEELLAAANGDDLGARIDAAIDLIRLDDPRGIEVLTAATGIADPSMRRRVLMAHQVAHVITNTLVAGLADDLFEHRIQAAEIILGLVETD